MPGGGDQRGEADRAGTPIRDGAAAARAPWVDLLSGCALVITIWLVAASRWIVDDTVVPWDSKNQFFAFFRFLASSLSAGHSPLWNPYHYGGHPSVADPQSLVFSPAFVIWALFDPEPSIRAFDLLVYAHLLVGALAVVGIGWRAKWPVAACVLAAAVFMLGGAASGRLQHTGIILSYGLFPLALLLLQLALERRSLAAASAFALVAAVLALGRNQVALLLSFVLIAFAIGHLAGAQDRLRHLRERMPVLLVMAVGGAALIAIPMLLTIQFAVLSNRPDVVLDVALKGSLHPANLATLAFANIFGSHLVNYWGPGWRMPEIQFTDQSFNYMFVGAVPVLLLLWIGIAGGRALRPGRRLVAGVMATALLYMLGRYTPFFPLAFEWLPGANLFRRPVDGSFVFLAALAFMVGHLLNDYVREGSPRRNGECSFFVAVTICAVLAGAFVISVRAGEGRAATVEFLRGVQVFMLVAAILVLARGVRGRAIAAIGMTAIAVAELLWWNAASHLNAESRAIYAVLERPQADDAQAIDLLDRELRRRRAEGEHPRVEILGVGGPWQNLAMVRGWEGTNGYNPLRIGFYDRLVSPGEATFSSALRLFPASFDSYECALARALGLEYVVLNRPIDEVPRLARYPKAEMLMAGPKIWIYRLRRTMPRVSISARIQVADADAVNSSGQLLNSPSSDRVLVDDDTPPLRRYVVDSAQTDNNHARIISMQPGLVEIESESGMGGVLALHNIYYPGWVAEIDGREAPILRTDILFRGVEVPPGRHRITFRYAPFSPRNLGEALRLALWRR